MYPRCSVITFLLLAGAAAAQMPGGAASHVQVEKAVSGKDRIVRKSIAHTEPVRTVNIAAAVSGYLKEVHFREGSMVKAGEVLMVIDPIRYQAAEQKARAAVSQLEAQIVYAGNRYARLSRLAEQQAASKEDMESALATLEELKAKRAAAQANLVKAQKDLEDCTIKAEITGRIGRLNFSAGNYVNVGEKLATITQIDPIYMRFPLSQADVNGIFGGPEKIADGSKVSIITANGVRYPSEGKVDIVDNRLTGDTDSYTLWAKFDNKEHVLTPRGIAALYISQADTAEVTMVPLTAVQHDAEGAFVHVVDENNVVSRRNVLAGPIQGRLQSIYSGLKPGEDVIVDGAHKTRVGGKIIPVYPNSPAEEQTSVDTPESEPVVMVKTVTVSEMEDPTVITCQGARTEAINTVELRPLVQGLLAEPQFKEGDMVKKGDVLFRIDPARYQALVDVRKSEIAQLDVRIQDALVKLNRQKYLLARNATSKDEVESAQATFDNLQAARLAAVADFTIALDDLSRCTIHAGMDARIGRVNFSGGNYITDSKSPLASLVQISPIYVRFSMSENRILSAFGNVEKLVNEAEISLVTASGNTYSEKGHVSFCDNVIRTATDTQNIWAFFDNKDGKLSPGGVVTIQVRRKPEFKVPSVPSDAVLVDTAGHYVFVEENGVAHRRQVICGGTTEDGRTAIHYGLTPGQNVIINNLATMTEGTPVQPE